MSNLTNYAFINELRTEVGRDVVLFSADGISYFGNLLAVDYNGVAVLGPATLSSSGFVEIVNPTGVTLFETLTNVDLSFVVAKGASITADPFVPPVDDTPANTASVNSSQNQNSSRPSYPGCQGEMDLVKRLCLQIGNFVTIATLGGFLFSGTLATVNNMVAKVIVESIFTPGSGDTPLSGINTAIINLEAMTSFSV